MAFGRHQPWRRLAAALSLALIASAPGSAGAFFFSAFEYRKECAPGTLVCFIPYPTLQCILVFFPKGGEPFGAQAEDFDDFKNEFERNRKKLRGESSSSSLGRVAAAAAPTHAVVGDFNRDGHPDSAITDRLSSSVSVALGQADGSFLTPLEFPTGTAPLRIASGRFDADDSIDLLTANFGGGSGGDLSLLRGRANGEFRAPVSISAGAGTRPVDVAAGDFDEDGVLGFVAATTDASTSPTILRLGNGDGTFQPATPLGASAVQSLVVVQLNARTTTSTS